MLLTLLLMLYAVRVCKRIFSASHVGIGKKGKKRMHSCPVLWEMYSRQRFAGFVAVLVPLGWAGRGRRDSLHILYPCVDTLYTTWARWRHCAASRSRELRREAKPGVEPRVCSLLGPQLGRGSQPELKNSFLFLTGTPVSQNQLCRCTTLNVLKD